MTGVDPFWNRINYQDIRNEKAAHKDGISFGNICVRNNADTLNQHIDSIQPFCLTQQQLKKSINFFAYPSVRRFKVMLGRYYDS